MAWDCTRRNRQSVHADPERIPGVWRIVMGATFVAAMGSVAAYAVQTPAAEPASDAPALDAETRIEASDCASCHAVDRTVVGPSYVEVAGRYRGQPGAAETVARSIRDGGAGRWGEIPMTAHPDLADADLEAIVAWILALPDEGEDRPARDAAAAVYAYTLADGADVELAFPIFVEGQAPTVTRDVFRGYLMYNSYCYRCHGQDATGSQFAPDLRVSLANGMTVEEYLAMAMVGDEAQGMPGWAGFLTEEEVRQTYMYVEGRRLGLVPGGRPPSDY